MQPHLPSTKLTTSPSTSRNSRSVELEMCRVTARLVSCVIWRMLRGSGPVTQCRSPRCCKRCNTVMPAGILHVYSPGSPDAVRSNAVKRVHLRHR